MKNLKLKIAKKNDVLQILQFIRDLADYQGLLSETTITQELLIKNLFGKKKMAEVVFAQINNEKIGFVLFFHNFSTFVGKPGIYIEDIYVKPEYRGLGVGKKIFSYLVKLAKKRDCATLELLCLNWNKKSIDFYKSLGAKPLEEWTMFKFDRDAIDRI